GAVPAVTAVLPYAAAAVLMALGLWRLARSFSRPLVLAGVGADAVARPRVSDAAAAGGLIGLLVLSPGEALLPVYVGAGVPGWGVVILLTAAFALGAVLGMVLLTALALVGVERFRLGRLARYEDRVFALTLIALAIFVAAHPA